MKNDIFYAFYFKRSFRILATDREALQFVADIRWRNDGYLYLLSSRFHKFFLRSVDSADVNVRILRLPLVANRRPERFFMDDYQYLGK